ncbi:hypothetical protein GMSM_37260 [Geomonas sp. Red276]
MRCRCENCGRKIGRMELVHGIRHGTLDPASDMFIPAKDSAATILCSKCSEMLLNLVYAKLNKPVQLSKPRYHYR